MTFKNLEDRFTKTAQDIYNRFPSPPGQYVQVKPDTASAYSRIKDDSRQLPTVSTKRDLERVAKFLKSGNGILFIGKQTLLQTGNTFAETRLYDPSSPLANTVPFTHFTRHINQGSISKLLGTSTTSTMDSRGFLQKDTVNLFTVNTAGSNILSRFLDKFITPINSLLGAFAFTSQNTARPEDTIFTDKFGPFIKIPQPKTERGSKSIKVSTPNEEKDFAVSWQSSFNKYVKQSQPDITGTRIFRKLEKSNNGQGYFNQGKALYGADLVSRNISDPYNLQKYPFVPDGNNSGVTSETPKFTGLYDGIFEQIKTEKIPSGDGVNSDIIKFIFTTSNNDVHFRAFLSNINQTVTPEFNEQRYIGRTERFVTYGGVKRGVSLKFHIASFSQAETNTVWTKVNYLTGLAFPKGVSTSGFMIPPLFKITIGGIYDHQPCYINTLEFTMLDETTTFDIDAEVSQVIEVSMQLTLLEKTTQLYDSPFYAITEALPVTEARTILKNIEATAPLVANMGNLPVINTPSADMNYVTPWKAVKGKIISDFKSDTSQLSAALYNPTIPDSVRYAKQGTPGAFTDLQKAGLSTSPPPIGLFKAPSDPTSLILRSKMTTNFSIPPIVLYDENSNYKGPNGQSVGLETINGTTNLLSKINSGLPL